MDLMAVLTDSTIPWSLTGRESLLGVMGKKLRTIKLFTKAVLLLILRLVLVIAGLGFICLAAYSVSMPLGFLVTGLSLLIFEWVVKR